MVFQDGSFATFDEDAHRSLHSDEAKDVAAAEDDDEEDDDEQEETVVWAYLESDHVSPMKGGLFLSLLMQKTNQKGEKQYELLVYQVDVPNKPRSQGGVLGAVLLVRRRVKLPDDVELVLRVPPDHVLVLVRGTLWHVVHATLCARRAQ